MTPSKLNITLLTMLIVIAAYFLFGSIGHANKRAAQAQKSLEIERYPNEPLELVNLKIGANSIKGESRSLGKASINGGETE